MRTARSSLYARGYNSNGGRECAPADALCRFLVGSRVALVTVVAARRRAVRT